MYSGVMSHGCMPCVISSFVGYSGVMSQRKFDHVVNETVVYF